MSTKDKVILALDQASSLTGYCVINVESEELISHGILSLKDIKGEDISYDEKVENVKQFLQKCIDFFNPDIVIIEDIQKQVNIKTFKDLAYLQGVLKNYLYANEIGYSVLTPSEWRGVVGVKGGRGIKREVLKQRALAYVKAEYGIEVKEDEAESICIAKSGAKLLKNGQLKILKEI